MIVMEMIMCLSLHIKRGAAPQLSVWDANREMFYGLRHTEESREGVMTKYTTPSLMEPTPGSFSAPIPLVS